MAAKYPFNNQLAQGSHRRNAATAALRLLDEPVNKLVADELVSYSEFTWWVDPTREAVVHYILELDSNKQRTSPV